MCLRSSYLVVCRGFLRLRANGNFTDSGFAYSAGSVRESVSSGNRGNQSSRSVSHGKDLSTHSSPMKNEMIISDRSRRKEQLDYIQWRKRKKKWEFGRDCDSLWFCSTCETRGQDLIEQRTRTHAEAILQN